MFFFLASLRLKETAHVIPIELQNYAPDHSGFGRMNTVHFQVVPMIIFRKLDQCNAVNSLSDSKSTIDPNVCAVDHTARVLERIVQPCLRKHRKSV